MKKKLTKRELDLMVKAVHYAIEWEKTVINSFHGCRGFTKEVRKSEALIRSYVRLLVRLVEERNG